MQNGRFHSLNALESFKSSRLDLAGASSHPAVTCSAWSGHNFVQTTAGRPNRYAMCSHCAHIINLSKTIHVPECTNWDGHIIHTTRVEGVRTFFCSTCGDVRHYAPLLH